VRDVAFWLFTLILLGGAIGVVSARSLFRAAFSLAATLVATAGFYLLLSAPLLAAVQILLYTGGVLTLAVFALVVAGDQTAARRWRQPVPAAALAAAVLAALGAAVARVPDAVTPGSLESGREVGLTLFSDYLVPFELLSVLLLGAVFGALLLARKDRA
jgi:NADH-quinone oxidoreductase subunit J